VSHGEQLQRPSPVSIHLLRTSFIQNIPADLIAELPMQALVSNTRILSRTSPDLAVSDVIFNAGSIALPISASNPSSLTRVLLLTPHPAGFYAGIWWLDALGGLLLALVVIFNWSQTCYEHIAHLSGFSATADQRNIRESPEPQPLSAPSLLTLQSYT